jgi:hypothetical protein
MAQPPLPFSYFATQVALYDDVSTAHERKEKKISFMTH